MEEYEEALLTDLPKVISYECTKKITEQMEKNICKINSGNNQGTGFFCEIPFPNKNKILPVLVTNNHIINYDLLFKKDKIIEIEIKEEEKTKKINLNDRIKYTNKKYDITIIEIKKEDNIKNYLVLDDLIMDDILNNINKNEEFINETIYIIQYPEKKLSVSYGILSEIYEDEVYNFNHRCNTTFGSSGSPILNTNGKVIGIHKKGHESQQYKIGAFLNEPIKEFIELNNKENEKALKEVNIKYFLNIKDTKIERLDLGFKELGNEFLNELSKIKLKQLMTLNLNGNNISDIKILEKTKFENLNILNLGHNKISDINILEKVNFNELKELNLGHNLISDINVFEKVKFNKLEGLDLGYNNISDINVFKKANFKKIKNIYFEHNNISEIEVLEEVKFKKLEVLHLDWNKISDIDILENANFKELKILNLEHNSISDISVLENVKLEKLEELYLGYNKISDITIFTKSNFNELKQLNLAFNNISDIKVFENIKDKFKKLEKLEVSSNLIQKKKSGKIISELKSTIAEFKI